MEILDLVDGTPASNGQLDQADFMNPRRLQRREKPANAHSELHLRNISVGSIVSSAGSWIYCPMPTTSGPSMIGPNGFAWRRGFLILATKRGMASTRRSAL